jgi:hypothetical protein
MPLAALHAAEADDSKADSKSKANKPETVHLFDGIKDGRLEVKFITLDSRKANLLIHNTTKQPLSVDLPDAFAGVPVLAQFGGGGGGQFGGGGGGLGGGGGGGQSVGGGGGGLGGGGGGFGGGGGGQFNVPAERVGKLQVKTVCLEHGKPEPRAAMSYSIVPIEEFSQDAELQELLTLVGTGSFSPGAEQAAAWHISNKMSWEELANKRIQRANGTSQRYFSIPQLREATALVSIAKQKAAQRESKSPGELTAATP